MNEAPAVSLPAGGWLSKIITDMPAPAPPAATVPQQPSVQPPPSPPAARQAPPPPAPPPGPAGDARTGGAREIEARAELAAAIEALKRSASPAQQEDRPAQAAAPVRDLEAEALQNVQALHRAMDAVAATTETTEDEERIARPQSVAEALAVEPFHETTEDEERIARPQSVAEALAAEPSHLAAPRGEASAEATARALRKAMDAVGETTPAPMHGEAFAELPPDDQPPSEEEIEAAAIAEATRQALQAARARMAKMAEAEGDEEAESSELSRMRLGRPLKQFFGALKAAKAARVPPPAAEAEPPPTVEAAAWEAHAAEPAGDELAEAAYGAAEPHAEAGAPATLAAAELTEQDLDLVERERRGSPAAGRAQGQP